MRRAMLAGVVAGVMLVAFNSTSAFAATTSDTTAPVDTSRASTPPTSATPPADVATATSDASSAAPAAATPAVSDVHAAALATDIAVEEHPGVPQPPLITSSGASYVGAGFAGMPDGTNAVTYGGVSIGNDPSNEASWVWNGTSWGQACASCPPGARGFSAMATDRATAATGVVLYGGAAALGSAGLPDAWIFADGAWTQLCATCPPGARFGSAMAGGGPDGDQVLLFGGASDFSGGAGTFFNDTWGFDGVTWTQLDAGVAGDPAARIGAAMAWDGTRFILFGGATPLVGGDPPIPIDDGTWAWAGDHWTQLCANAVACGPAPRAFAYLAALGSTDPLRRGALLVGGLTFIAQASPSVYGDIWLWHNGQWVQQVSPWVDVQPLFAPTGPVLVGAGLASLSGLCQVTAVGQTARTTVSTFSFGLDTNGDGVIDPCPVVPPPVPPTPPTPTPAPDNVVVPAAENAAAGAETTAAGTLPFTGSDIAGPMTFATALLGVGLILEAGSRRKRVRRRASS